jgi:hypothetical protein
MDFLSTRADLERNDGGLKDTSYILELDLRFQTEDYSLTLNRTVQYSDMFMAALVVNTRHGILHKCTGTS